MESESERAPVSDQPPRYHSGWKALGLGRFEWVLLALFTIVLISQLFFPPIVGLADSGDFGRIIEPLGLRPTTETWGDTYFLYVNQDYQSAPRKPALLWSSELVLGRIAQGLNRLTSRDGLFHLQALTFVHLLLYLSGIFLILSATRAFSPAARVAVGAGLLLSATDVAYVATFNSFYTESATLIFLVIVVGIVLRETRAQRPSFARVAIYFAAAALFIAAKPQNSILVLPLAALPVALFWRWKRRWLRVAAVAPAVALFLWTGFLARSVSPLFKIPIIWDTLFYSILPHSPSPQHDLQEFGLEPELARFAGTTSWNEGVPLYETAARYGYGDIARFYLRHPGRFASLCGVYAGEAFVWREPLLGNYTKQSGLPPRTQSRRFCGWSDFENRLLPKSIWFIGGFLLLVLGASGWELSKFAVAAHTRAAAIAVAALAVMAALSFAVVVAVEGQKDLVKHLYVFQVLFDGCLLAAAAYGADKLGRILPWGFWRSGSVKGS